ncbi:MAG: pyridoxal phosphate-dependent aminotransferase [Geodermatophilaceae bacterium]|nr:pyridoxal phosphate-dependent aminotransferase [Geodermatophilaceae bacterium]
MGGAAVTEEEYLVSRMRGFGTTIFAEMSALATQTGAINLGQGFPDTDGPPEIFDAAIEAIRAGHNQYPPGRGIPALRHAIAEHQQWYYGLTYDPDREVLVTAGATEAIAATILALCETGDEVVVLEPTYDSYAASIALAGAVLRPVTLHHPDYRLDVDALRAAVTPRTRLLLINSPHNPTGRVLDRTELTAIAELAVERDLVVVTDEVYEHLAFDREHIPLATLPGMRDRTVTISSAGKTFSCTGWKIGWVCASPALVDAVGTTKQFLTYVNGAPFQHAIVTGLALPEHRIESIRRNLRDRRDQLSNALLAAGLDVHPCEATYFLTVDVATLGETDGLAFCRALPERIGVVAIPSSVFYLDPGPARTLVRFAFCKRPDVLDEAVRRLAGLGTSMRSGTQMSSDVRSPA